MLAFSSKPRISAIELKYNHNKITIIVPMEPYNLLYNPKLFTKYENPSEVKRARNVAIVEPGEINFHCDLFAGAK
jgi:hypothetical protein